MSDSPTSIIEFFGDISDPRRNNANKRHELIDILVIALCGMLSGADDWVSIEIYGKSKEDWFSKFLQLPNGIPSHDTFTRVFSAIDPEQFMDCFLSWVNVIRTRLSHEVVAIDGKCLRRSHDGDNKAAIHMVSAWACENNLVLGQVKTHEKSNEITAIPELLKAISLTNTLITIDAIGCQKTIAQCVIDGGGDYLLAVKDNQPQLKSAIQALLDDKTREASTVLSMDYCETQEKNRDRNEVRRCWSTSALDSLMLKDDWKNLHQVAVVETERTQKEKTATERRYYICSADIKADQVLNASRQHWGIENKLHWSLDMSFREDESRVRKGNGAENLARLRHIALNILKQDKTKKVGIKNKRLNAGWDYDYLLHLLGIDYQS